MISGDTFEAANCDRRFIGATTPAGRFTGAITYAAENTGENIAFPVLYIRVSKVALGDLADVFRYVRMRRAGPLAIHNLVEIIRVICIGGLHH